MIANSNIMVDRVDQVNMNDAMLSANTFSVKEELCQKDSFVEHKVFVSETAIAIDNTELQGPIWHGKVEQYEKASPLDNIKPELVLFEVNDIQNDNVKVEAVTADDIKIRFDNNRLLYCEYCEEYYKDYCIECGMLVHILNKHVLNNADGRAQDDIPSNFLEIQNCFGQIGIYALRIIPAGVKFGPLTGLSTTECPWEMNGEKFVLDKNKSKNLNWMQYVNPTRNTSERNLSVFHCEDNVYYQSTRPIQAGDELLVYFGEEYGNNLNKIVRLDYDITKHTTKDIFACTFCCLGFSSLSQLAKHKTICVEDTTGNFSIEELTQCSFCKLYLDLKEYLDHHMDFCRQRNARKCNLPTSSAKEATTALNGRKTCLCSIYKCEQCKYRTMYQAELKAHIKQHYEVKMYKCGICNRRFKTKGSLRPRVENTHAYLGGKDDQEESTTDYRNTDIKVEQSNSRDRNKMFKCLQCVIRGRYRQSLRKQIGTKYSKKIYYKCDSREYGTNKTTDLRKRVKPKHLKEFDYLCDSCEFGTNIMTDLEVHIKTKHLNKFDYKCDSCEFETNGKSHLKRHIKTKHLRKFDYKCDSCEFETNLKNHLERHVKSKHLKEFEYKCDTCEFGTNVKNNLEVHIKTKHLKEFKYKCDSCEYRTNDKRYFERHLKTKHLKTFSHECDSCEFRSNNKHHFKYHIKSKHLMKFDYKCDSCEFGTNVTNHLAIHIKTKHLKEFDYKCDFCQFKTNNKSNLKRHIKTKHLTEFDYKCDSCEFGANLKCHLERHIKNKHLKVFNYKCDSCEYRTNDKHKLKQHVKTKHLKKYDYKCDSCGFGTNCKQHLELHIKTKHLNEFDYKCTKCEFGTNIVSRLEGHIKTKHLKEFDYRCGSCEYRTNDQRNFKRHIKNKHLKQCDYKCDTCEFETNLKSHLDRHTATHLNLQQITNSI